VIDLAKWLFGHQKPDKLMEDEADKDDEDG